MAPEPPDDDKCQVTMCDETHFTYCPHCKLFVCIEHLNEHYANYKQEYQLLLNDGKQQQILNKQFIDDIEKEKKQLTDVFDQEIHFYQTNDQYFHEKSIQSTIRPQDCADLRLHIAQSLQKRLKFKKFIHQIQQLINDSEYHQPNGMIEETSSPLTRIKNEEMFIRPKINKSSPLAQFSIDYEEIDDDEDEEGGDEAQHQNNGDQSRSDENEKLSNPNSRNSSNTKSSKKEATTTDDIKDMFDESSRSDEEADEDDNTDDDDNHGSDPDFSGGRRLTGSPKVRRKKDIVTSRPAVNHFQVGICPLADKSYGIDLNKHPLRYVPCTRSNISSIYLFTHLRVFHCLNSKASLRLVRHVMYHGCERDFDLFSQATESLVNILPKSYRGRCPLTKLGVYGLNKYHDIRLCQDSQTHENTGLLNHFVVYHCLSYPWANKLCNAMQAGDCEGNKQIVFKPNEPIKAKKWLTAQGKIILAKRYSSVRKRRKKIPNNTRKK